MTSLLITFFVACIFYASAQNLTHLFFEGNHSFIRKYDLETEEAYSVDNNSYQILKNIGYRVIVACYFMCVTLCTVGYGDLSPQSNEERIFGILNMLFGLAIFSYVFQEFTTITQVWY